MPYYKRIDTPASASQNQHMLNLAPESVTETKIAGEPIIAKLTKAPGNSAPIGGLKVVAKKCWFAARPSGTENIYKLYAESFKSQLHLDLVVSQAQEIIRHSHAKKRPQGSSLQSPS